MAKRTAISRPAGNARPVVGRMRDARAWACLSDAQQRAVMRALEAGELSYCEIARELGLPDRRAVSHAARLRGA